MDSDKTVVIVPPAGKPSFFKSKEEKTPKERINFIVLEVVAVFFWIYMPIKLFVFDFDTWILKTYFPLFSNVLDFKFPIIVGIVAVFWLIFGNKYFFGWFFYIMLYPLILFIKILYIAIKQNSWTIVFAILNTVISFFKSIRYSFITSAIFVIALFLIIFSSNRELLWVSIFSLLVLLILSFVRSFIFVFQPSTIFQIYSKVIQNTPKFFLSALTRDDEIRILAIEQRSEAQMQTIRINIQTLMLCNRALLFFSNKLKQFQESKFNIISYVSKLLTLVIYTVTSFAAINFALFKINPEYFATTSANPFLFFYYSFRTFLFGSIPEITPVQFYTQLASMLEAFSALLLITFLVTLFFTIRDPKYKDELSKTIEETRQAGAALENTIGSNYNLTVDQAIEEIRKMQNNLLNLILWFSKGADDI